MATLEKLLLIFTLLIVSIHGQGSRGGGGGGSSGGGSRTGGYRSTNSRGSCHGDECRRDGIIAGSVIGGIFGLLAIIFGSYFIYRKCKGKPDKSNERFVNKSSKRTKRYEKDNFDNGVWSSRYYQYGRWHGPHDVTLQFNRETNRVSGEGMDDVGSYNMEGVFSPQEHKMGLTKTYRNGTGDLSENSGHSVTIQTTWNEKNSQFEGKWFVDTKHYHDNNKIEFKLQESSPPMYIDVAKIDE